MKNRNILTIPNVITLFRIILIPFIIWAYCVEENFMLAAAAVILSGISDVADGIIARKFNMISDFGKAFDPIADKLTQIAVMVCLVSQFHIILLPIILIIVKEIITGIMSIVAIKKSGCVMGAVWHGKVNTVFLYSVMVVHMLWADIPSTVSTVLVLLSSAMMIFSSLMYFARNLKLIKGEEV